MDQAILLFLLYEIIQVCLVIVTIVSKTIKRSYCYETIFLTVNNLSLFQVFLQLFAILRLNI